MEEKDIVIFLSLVMIVFAALFAYYYNDNFITTNAFNFKSANIALGIRTVNETLYFVPDQSYHTLFRTFASQIASSGNNTVAIQSVSCSAGTPYYRTYAGICYTFLNGSISNGCMPNTENNEYGCTFGDVRGFDTGMDYFVGARYTLNPSNLFLIDGKYYIKFVAYSAGNHYDLKTGVNLFVKGGSASTEYPPNQDVVIYIPYNGSTQGFNIITQNGFGFDNGTGNYGTKLYNFFLFLVPLILFDGIWLYFAQQKKEPPVPSQLDDLPNERKPWEVSAYFTPPFMAVKKNFYATLMLDLYRRKVIDVKKVDAGLFSHKTFVKINQYTGDLDDVEKKFLVLLGDISSSVGDKNRDGDYFDVGKAGKQFSSRYQLSLDSQTISEMVKQEGSNFIDIKGYSLFFGLLIVIVIVVAFLNGLLLPLLFSSILLGVLTFAANRKTPLLVKYKQDYYEEYLQWMSFKHGLSHLSSVKNAKADAIVQWEKYLVYATALGVADKVLEQLKALNIIDRVKLGNYSSVFIASNSFSSAMTAGGGGGGVGGGGVGGGGGGGR